MRRGNSVTSIGSFRATALFAVINWRILYAMLLARLDGELPCEALLQPIEWRALYCRVHGTAKLPTEPPSLAQVVLWIAKLSGYLARKHDRPPGPTVMWRGFLTLHEITEMYRIFRQNEWGTQLEMWGNLRSTVGGELAALAVDRRASR